MILENHKCMECGYISKEIEVKFPKKPEYDRVKKLHPNWDLSKGQLGYIVCPKCKTKNDIIISTEACKDLNTARQFVKDVGELAKKYDANYYIVTDGASGTHNSGNPAVKHARDTMKKWEAKHGFDPDEDWSKNESALLEMQFNGKDYQNYMTTGNYSYMKKIYDDFQHHSNKYYYMPTHSKLPDNIDISAIEDLVYDKSLPVYKKYWKNVSFSKGDSPFKFYRLISYNDLDKYDSMVFSSIKMNPIKALKKDFIIYQHNFTKGKCRISMLIFIDDGVVTKIVSMPYSDMSTWIDVKPNNSIYESALLERKNPMDFSDPKNIGMAYALYSTLGSDKKKVYVCPQCNYVGSDVTIKFPKKPDYKRIKKLHPDWDLDNGEVGYIVCPKCKTKNDILIYGNAILEQSRKDMSPDEFGVPGKKKFPLDSEAHVKSAIKFFNYVEPDDEAELARRIKKKAKEYGVVIRCGEKNRLSKYITEEYIKEFMAAGSIGNCAYAVTNGAIKQAAYQNGYEYSVTDHYPYTKKKKMHKNKEQNNVFSESTKGDKTKIDNAIKIFKSELKKQNPILADSKLADVIWSHGYIDDYKNQYTIYTIGLPDKRLREVGSMTAIINKIKTACKRANERLPEGQTIKCINKDDDIIYALIVKAGD